MEIRRDAGPHAARSFLALNRHAQPAPAPAVNCLNALFLSFPSANQTNSTQRDTQTGRFRSTHIRVPLSSVSSPTTNPQIPVISAAALFGRREEGRRRGSRRRRRRRREAQQGRRARCSCGTGSTGCWPPSACGRRRPRSSSLASTTPARPRCSTCSRTSGWCSTSRRSTRRRKSSASARSSSRPSTSAATRSLAASGRIITQRLML